MSKLSALVSTLTLDEHRPVLFVSDVHLHVKELHLTTLFLRFLHEKAPFAQALFILGDLFNAWLGDDIRTSFEEEIATHLKKISQEFNIPIYFLPGNRDFLLSKRFSAEAGFTLLNDPSVFKLWNKDVLLTHGDLLCTADRNYQYFRLIVQHPITKFIFTKLPKNYRQRIAQRLRQNSKRYQAHQPMAKLDVTEQGVTSVVKKNPTTKMIIHGHVHKANCFTHIISGKNIERYVLGTWDKAGSYIEFYKDNISLKVFE